MTSISSSSIARLRDLHSWPDTPPSVRPVNWVMDYGGRAIIREAICTRKLSLIVEVGVFVGGSVRQWLELSPEIVVIAIDPWPQIKGVNSFYDSHPVGRFYGAQLREHDGLYNAFLSSLWNERRRVVPMRGAGVDMLKEIYSLGVRPDLIFIDADKQGSEIQVCDKLFPDAIICGDDWLWSDGRHFPTQQPVRASVARRKRVLKCVSNTWLIDDEPWTIRERLIWFRELPVMFVRLFTAWRRSLRGRDSSGNPI
jgi:hypothetical protein